MTITKYEASALSHFFSASIIRDFSQRGRASLFAQIFCDHPLSGIFPKNANVGQVFDQAFNLLKDSTYRDDYVYRSAIIQKILLGRHNLNTSTLLSEVRTGTSKADVVVLNGTSTAYEIKSERDSLTRLQTQLDNYRRVFASVNVVTSASHLKEVQEKAPQEVGIIVLTKNFTLHTERKAQNHPERTDPAMILEILRVDEAADVLAALGIEIPQVPNTQIRGELRKIFRDLDPASVHDRMVKVIKVRRSQAELSSFISSIPTSLRAATLAIQPNRKSQSRIKEATETPLSEALTWR